MTLSDAKLFEYFKHIDNRGVFCKIFSDESKSIFPGFVPKEFFLSTNEFGVLRGMHFQHPPKQQSKIIIVTKGKIHDVIIDLRNGKNYGQVKSFELNCDDNKALFIPGHFAHGFVSLESETVVNYIVDESYDSQLEDCIHWDSFEYKWPVEPKIISKRDSTAQKFAELSGEIF